MTQKELAAILAKLSQLAGAMRELSQHGTEPWVSVKRKFLEDASAALRRSVTMLASSFDDSRQVVIVSMDDEDEGPARLSVFDDDTNGDLEP